MHWFLGWRRPSLRSRMFTLNIDWIPCLGCLTDVVQALNPHMWHRSDYLMPPPISCLPFNDAAGASMRTRLTQEATGSRLQKCLYWKVCCISSLIKTIQKKKQVWHIFFPLFGVRPGTQGTLVAEIKHFPTIRKFPSKPRLNTEQRRCRNQCLIPVQN